MHQHAGAADNTIMLPVSPWDPAGPWHTVQRAEQTQGLEDAF